ncbi:MAG: hypothetical protein ACP5HK_02865 [Acidilobus sp.]
MACRRGALDRCSASWVICSSGLPSVLGEPVKAFRYLRPGTLIPAVSQDMEWAYFLYFNDAGAGFYLVMRNASFNDPECAATVRQELMKGIAEVLVLDRNRPLVEYIVSNAMFPS